MMGDKDKLCELLMSLTEGEAEEICGLLAFGLHRVVAGEDVDTVVQEWAASRG